MKNVYALSDVEETAEKVVAHMKENGSHILALSGDLGAGKTTLVQALARGFGITSAVQSPTFTILKSYDIVHPLYTHFVHMDAYRITDEAELTPIHFSEYLSPNHFVCIEWPEQIPAALENISHTVVRIEHRGDNREIKIYEKK